MIRIIYVFACDRVNGNLATFKNEAAYFWIVDAREYNNSGKLVDGSMAEVKPDEKQSCHKCYCCYI